MRNCCRQLGWPAITTLMVLGMVAAAFASLSCSPGGYSGKAEAVSFGALPTGSAGLIYIAQAQPFFEANGLNVAVRDYATGVATTDAMLKGEVDIAWSAELPIVRKAFAEEKISIIAVLSRFVDDQFLFGRKDRGIGSLADFKGKRIGIPRNTIAEFYLGRFLELNGLNLQDVTLVDVQPPQSVEAITKGAVDAVVTWDPFSSQINTQLADGVVVLPVQSNQPGFGVISVRNDWLSEHPDTIKRFLKSLTQAEDYLIRNPEASNDIVQKRVNLDDAAMKTFWSQTRFNVSLDQSLVTAMEDEARWMIKNNLTAEKATPDFLDYIYVDGLKAVRAQSVGIVK